ncbi:MAG: DNA polymerase Y family protein [Rhodospirillales bacterium]|nr:DNA polymerase Y family protein [Rhodospirillales bacterium]
MKRVVSLWLPSFSTDRLSRHKLSRHRHRHTQRRLEPPAPVGSGSDPLVTTTAAHGGVRIVSVDPTAAAAGLRPGLTLAEAHALSPGLNAAEADPPADRKALEALADWCGRYTPWTAVDAENGGTGGWAGPFGGGAGAWLDISGCAHLFGGEAALVEDLVTRLRRFGFAATAAVADSAGAAWATARFAADTSTAVVVPPGEQRRVLAPLPVAGLRLPAAVVDGLDQVGLRRIGDLLDLPRPPLAARFGAILLTRLDQALARADEPLSPRLPVPALAARLAFAEPVARPEDIAAATRHLLRDLAARLVAARQGARRLELRFYRADGGVASVVIGTSRPAREPDHLARLFRDKLESVDAGFGIEVAVLAATVVAPFPHTQMTLTADSMAQAESLARLVDRLSTRLEADNVAHLVERASHIPERRCSAVAAIAEPPAAEDAARHLAGDERSRQPRPLQLLPWPEPIEAIAPVPDGPPVMFRRGRQPHRVAAAEGPERIAPEWWLEDDGHDPERQSRIRDYYRVEDCDGRRFWIYREGFYRPDLPPRWYLHGLFA